MFADIAIARRSRGSRAAAVEAALTPRTRAVMVVAYGGHPGEIEALRALCEARGLILLEDAAHAIGMRARRPPPRARSARAGAFSFFSNKNLAVGEGGAVVTDDDALAERCACCGRTA